MITIAQSLFEEGRSEAREEGVQEGFLEGLLSTLLRQGSRRFGPPSEQQVSKLNALTDTDQLDRMIDRVYDGQSWEEVLKAM